MSGSQVVKSRWTVIRASAPQQRAPSQSFARARALVQCVCGVRKLAWVEDIQGGRSTGCPSRRCKARHEAAMHVLVQLEEMAALGRIPTEEIEAFRVWSQTYARNERARDEEREMELIR